MVGVTRDTKVWRLPRAPATPAPYRGRGRPRKPATEDTVTALQVARDIPDDGWVQVVWREGTKGPMQSRFAAVRVEPSHGETRGTEAEPASWLLIEWPRQSEEPTKYFLSSLPEDGDGQIGSAQGLHHIYKRPVALEIQDRTITVAGLGGIAARGTHAAAEWVEEDFPDRYFTRREVEALMGPAPCSVDILICHDGPAGASLRITQDAGSETITRLIRRLQPRLMMHGHYHDPPEPYRIGETLCVCLNHPRSWRFPNRDGGMGLVDPASREFVWASPMG